MSRLTVQLINDPELLRIADDACDEVLAEETRRVEVIRAQLLASPLRAVRARAHGLYPAITTEMVADRIHELTNVRVRLRRAEAELQRLRGAGVVR